jgi:hypothetical protein
VSPLLLRAIVAGDGAGDAEARAVDEARGGLIWVAAGRVGAWASELAERTEPGRAELLEHHRLVEAVCAVAACLPVQLGTWASSEEETRRLLLAREEALVGALARVGRRVEVAASCLWREPARGVAPPPSGTHSYPVPLPEGEGTRQGRLGQVEREGTQYLRERRAAIEAREAREARARALAEAIERASGATGADARHRLCPSEAVALSSALLVGRDEAEAVVGRLRELAGQLADVELVVNGPWPPYSFAGIS